MGRRDALAERDPKCVQIFGRAAGYGGNRAPTSPRRSLSLAASAPRSPLRRRHRSPARSPCGRVRIKSLLRRINTLVTCLNSRPLNDFNLRMRLQGSIHASCYGGPLAYCSFHRQLVALYTSLQGEAELPSGYENINWSSRVMGWGMWQSRLTPSLGNRRMFG